MEGRWRVGDVVVWIETGGEISSDSAIDFLIQFYDSQGNLICWSKIFQLSGVSKTIDGGPACAFIGNINEQLWLNRLLDHGESLSIQVLDDAQSHSSLFIERITVDFRLGPDSGTPSFRYWCLGELFEQGQMVSYYSCEKFVSPGLDKELEVDAGGGFTKPD